MVSILETFKCLQIREHDVPGLHRGEWGDLNPFSVSGIALSIYHKTLHLLHELEA